MSNTSLDTFCIHHDEIMAKMLEASMKTFICRFSCDLYFNYTNTWPTKIIFVKYN